MSHLIALPDGLSRETLSGLNELLRDITGTAPRGPLYFAPGLIVLLPSVAKVMPLPQPTEGLALVQDYQSVRFGTGLAADAPVEVRGALEERGATTEYHLTIGDAAETKMALRLVPKAELATAQPLKMRDLQAGPQLYCTAAHVARYLELSGDPNALHHDHELAKAMGFAAPVVPGLLLSSLIQPSVELAYPDARIATVRVRFAAPVLTEQRFRVALQPRGSDRLRAFLLVEGGAAAIVDLEFAG